MWGLMTFTCHIFMLIVSSFSTDILNLEKNIVVLENDLAVQKNLNSVLRDHVTEKGLYHSRTRKAVNCSIQPVVFHARLVSNIYPLGSNQIIAYDSVITNEGNTYDTLTGMFEATSTGVYQFIATMWSTEGRNLDFQMIFNGGEVCAGRTTTTNQSMGICSAILQVPDGGRVFVRHKSTNGNDAKGNNYAVFTGHLIL
ncbi:C1q-related factor-like [Saccostrea cucullata]|uniref:C1q-related factor-like n=1 Tax=Saccostrea cuccullata TaxID=36930 RepID=UPI002ED0BF46